MPEQSITPTIQIIPPGVKKWGKVRLKADGCIVLENFTGKNYTYRVVNMTSGAERYICHKPEPVHESECSVMIQKFFTPKTASKTKNCIETDRENKITHDRHIETLEHIFKTLLPKHGYNLRTEQLELAKHIMEALRGRMVSLSEAGVGIGKTHAYLIAAAIIKRRRVNDFWLRGKYPNMAWITEMPMVVATSSIALQKAIVKDYIPEISKILMKHGVITKPLTSAIRKGKEHYICDKRLLFFWRQSPRENIKLLLEPLIKRKSSIDLDEMDFLDSYAKRRICVTGRCGTNCEMRTSCRYIAFFNDVQSGKYDFQICNHNYLLADVKRRAKGQKTLIPDYQAIIIDEAHKFLPAARSMYGTELSSLELPQITNTIRSFIFMQNQGVTELRQNVVILEDKWKRLFKTLNNNIPDIYDDDEAERYKTEIKGDGEKYLRSIRKLIGELKDGIKRRQVIQKYENQYSYTLWELNEIQERIAAFERYGDLIYWLEQPEGLYSNDRNETGATKLCAIPKKLGDMLHNDLWCSDIPLILTSGTLSASGDFTHIKTGLGLNNLKPAKIMETSKASPFNYRDNALLYISNAVPFPDNKDIRYITAVANEMERLIRVAHGHTAALFTSYRVMEQVYEILNKRGLPFPIFMMGRGNVNAIEEFKQSGNGVLLAAGSMWEGIDLPGDILSMLIIVKLPFAVPDPISEYEKTKYSSMEEFKNAVITPEMLVKFIQGWGRMLRSESDTGVLVMFDLRVCFGKPYRGVILHALPNLRVTENIIVVEEFYKEKKEPEFFLI